MQSTLVESDNHFLKSFDKKHLIILLSIALSIGGYRWYKSRSQTKPETIRQLYTKTTTLEYLQFMVAWVGAIPFYLYLIGVVATKRFRARSGT